MKFLILFVPVVLASMIFAIRNEFNRNYLAGKITLLVLSIFVMARFILVGMGFDNPLPLSLQVLEMFFSLYAPVLMYMYLCDQCGTKWNNREGIGMAVLPVLTLLEIIMPQFPIREIIVVMECIIIAFCMYRLTLRLKQFGLKFNRPMKSYFVWMFFFLAFTILTFVTRMQYSTDPRMQWLFFIGYTLIIACGYFFVPYSFKVSPIVTQEENKPVSLDDFVKQHQKSVERLHTLLERDRVYLQGGITLEEVAGMTGTNRTYLARLMKIEFGRTFADYITDARINHSKNLLMTTDMTLEEISAQSGFQSSSAFCRVFKKVTEMTPTQWRKEQNHQQ